LRRIVPDREKKWNGRKKKKKKKGERIGRGVHSQKGTWGRERTCKGYVGRSKTDYLVEEPLPSLKIRFVSPIMAKKLFEKKRRLSIFLRENRARRGGKSSFLGAWRPNVGGGLT